MIERFLLVPLRWFFLGACAAYRWGLRAIGVRPNRRPLATRAIQRIDGWEVEATELGITGCGDTLKDAKADLDDTVDALWESLSTAPRERLTPDAIALLEKMRRLGVGT